jgi:FMN phosphatase YigB (HAD superfamily)
VPELDPLFPEPPAEIDVLIASQSGKVDQPFVRVLDDGAKAVDGVHTAREPLQLLGNALVELHRGTGVDASSVPRHLRRDPAPRRARFPQCPPAIDELLGERPDLLQQRVRLFGRESVLRHTAMIENNVTAGQRLELADYDAVTLDAYGTLLELDDPVGALAEIVPEFDRLAVGRAFREEAAYYAAHAHQGRDERTLAKLRADCTDVFNHALGSRVTPEEFTGALRFVFLPGALEAVGGLRRRGLEVAVVSNWDIELRDHLAPLDVLVVTSAHAGVPKPDPAPLRLALDRLGIEPARTLHIGDGEADRESAAAAGTAFAPAPIDEALARWR